MQINNNSSLKTLEAYAFIDKKDSGYTHRDLLCVEITKENGVINERLTTINKNQVTFLNMIKRFFGCGPLANMHFSLVNISKHLLKVLHDGQIKVREDNKSYENLSKIVKKMREGKEKQQLSQLVHGEVEFYLKRKISQVKSPMIEKFTNNIQKGRDNNTCKIILKTDYENRANIKNLQESISYQGRRNLCVQAGAAAEEVSKAGNTPYFNLGYKNFHRDELLSETTLTQLKFEKHIEERGAFTGKWIFEENSLKITKASILDS